MMHSLTLSTSSRCRSPSVVWGTCLPSDLSAAPPPPDDRRASATSSRHCVVCTHCWSPVPGIPAFCPAISECRHTRATGCTAHCHTVKDYVD